MQKKENEMVPLVVVVAGAEGKNQAMIDLCYKLHLNLFEVIALEVEDFHDVQKFQTLISKIKADSDENRRVYGVGLEYGANLLVRASAENKSLFQAIASIGNPLDL